LAVWAFRSLPLKNALTEDDAKAVEAAYLEKVSGQSDQAAGSAQQPAAANGNKAGPDAELSAGNLTGVFPEIKKPIRKRSKAHLAFVASQPCVVCQKTPCDAHHLKIAQPKALGRKVSDEFTVPLCRVHHNELHRHGNEKNWWANLQIMPMPIAKELWQNGPSAAPTSG
jgi:hypothetical protein